VTSLSEIFHRAKRPQKSSVRVLGIDLGTTNSLVAGIVWDSRNPGALRAETIRIAQPTLMGTHHHELVPSIVAFHNGNVVVGEGAKLLRTRSDIGLSRDVDVFWDTKSDIGEDVEYPAKDERLKTPVGVAAEILRFIMASVPDEWKDYDSVVISIPASFSAMQRQDTIEAARRAGLRLDQSNLIDEPIAALLSWLAESPSTNLGLLGPDDAHLLVFDFGGGTCDVAVCRTAFSAGQPAITPIAVSRYCQFGGSDIDAEIASSVLIPQFEEQNDVEWSSLPLSTRNRLMPFLIGIAEQLKIKLSKEARSKESFDVGEEILKSITVNQAGQSICSIGDTKYVLRQPKLSYSDYRNAIDPMVLRAPGGTAVGAGDAEKRIFAPIDAALDRANLQADDISQVLLVGGSSLHVPVKDALENHFTNAHLLAVGKPEEMQRSVARGAALQAWSIALFGESLLPAVCLQPMSLLTQEGTVPLVPVGHRLPFRDAAANRIGVPIDIAVGQEWPMRVEIVDQSGDSRLFSATWAMTGPLRKGTPLKLDISLDADQKLELELGVEGNKPFRCTLERPQTRTHVRRRRREAEKLVGIAQDAKRSADQRIEACLKAINIYRDTNDRTDAVNLATAAAESYGQNDNRVWNLLGITLSDNGDHRSAVEAYGRAHRVNSNDHACLFNQAISLKRLERHNEARTAAEASIEASGANVNPAYYMLAAEICEAINDVPAAKAYATKARAGMPAVTDATDWLLNWMLSFARRQKDTDLERGIVAEQRRRLTGQKTASGGLPTQLSQ
jgi:molecular chaperone DnaK